jgi:geranylgeranylglycerol-phosphate geranylgeranyltransferase
MFLFGGAAVGSLDAPVVLAVLAALSTFTREVIKDVEDLAGDREKGLRTLPVAIGARRSLWIGTGTLAVAVAVSPLPYLLGTFGAVYLAVVAVADAVMAYACYEAFADPTAAQAHFKYGTFLAAVAFVIGRAVLLV